MKKFTNRKNYGPVKGPDNRDYWLGRATAVTSIIVGYDNDSPKIPHICISQRGSEAYDHQGKWCMPCGYLDWDETGTEAVKRESWEEVGVDIDLILETKSVLRNNIEQPWYVRTDPKENRQNISLIYGLEFFDFKDIILKANNEGDTKNEVSQVLWMPITDIEKYSFAFNHEKLIRKYLAESSNG